MRLLWYYRSMKILIVDDSEKWRMFHETAVREILGDNVIIHTADCAKQGVERLTASVDAPYDVIFTDMQMESDFLPLLAGEWFIKQIKFFKEFKNTKIIIISAAINVNRIAEKYSVDYIPKYRCNNLEEYRNKL